MEDDMYFPVPSFPVTTPSYLTVKNSPCRNIR